MGTKNRRVAAYLPQAVNEAFVQFKIERGLATRQKPNRNDSQALVQLLSEFLKVAHQVEYSSAHSSQLVTLNQLKQMKQELVGQISELASELQVFKSRLDAEQTVRDLSGALTNGEMAKRIGIDPSTLSHWKKEKSSQQLTEDIRKRDPEQIGWLYISEIGRFKKESDIPSELQGSLLNC